MSFLNKVLKGFLGDKKAQDLKEVKKVVTKIKAVEPAIQQLSDDGLREKTAEFKENIKSATSKITAQIEQIQEQIKNSKNVDEKEALFSKIESLKKESYEIEEKVLSQILPEVFALVKETARRWAQNGEIRVTASDWDRQLAVAGKDFVEIQGDQAVWKNSWDAAGTPVNWDMVHYDVQFIGGIILHSGKIAEMATGEGKTLGGTLPIFLNALILRKETRHGWDHCTNSMECQSTVLIITNRTQTEEEKHTIQILPTEPIMNLVSII